MKERIAILGGGMAGLTAAFDLSATPELRDRYDVTVYQYGWRLGGKCASGRNLAQGSRIEEHGLHLWFGAYQNAFAMMRQCYSELDRPAGAPLATLEEAFKPGDSGILWDNFGDSWSPVSMTFPPNDRQPGDDSPIPGFWDMAWRALWYAWDVWRSLHLDRWEPGVEHRLNAWVERGMAEMEGALRSVEHLLEHGLLLLARDLSRLRVHQPELPGEAMHRQFLGQILHTFREWVWEHEIKAKLEDQRLRNWFAEFDLVVCLLAGVVRDELHEIGFDQLNEIELRDWLIMHGAKDVTLQSPMVRAWYCGVFAFLDGDPDRPDAAAGVSVQGMLRQQLGYKGSLLYKMQAGMGDAVIAPLYEVLRRRGVHFKFFHRVTRLIPFQGEITAIEVVRQVRLKHRDRYQPLVTIRDLPCWPSQPGWEQIEDGDQMAAAGVNLEVVDGLHAHRFRLVKGDDFDRVVLAISVAALPPICADLLEDAARPRLGRMIAATRTCMTQGSQVWMTKSLSELGWTAPSEISSTYVEPLDTYCDMTQLLAAEDWPEAAGIKSIAYLVGVMPDEDGDTLESTTARARDTGIEFLRRHAGALWPEFDWESVVGDGEGESRFHSQFWRANYAPTERYVLAATGTINSRLKADEAEWANLVLAGDWVRNGLDLGCVEATVMAGRQAARAITGLPVDVPGENHSFLNNVAGPTNWSGGDRVL